MSSLDMSQAESWSLLASQEKRPPTRVQGQPALEDESIHRGLAATDGARQKIKGQEKPCGSSAFPNETALFWLVSHLAVGNQCPTNH